MDTKQVSAIITKYVKDRPEGWHFRGSGHGLLRLINPAFTSSSDIYPCGTGQTPLEEWINETSDYILLHIDASRCVHSQNLSNAEQAPATKSATRPGGPGAVLVGAGDIASCDDLAGAQATAKLLDSIPGTVFAVGDLAYPDGSDERMRQSKPWLTIVDTRVEVSGFVRPKRLG
jgi:hypothetical protein